MRGSKDVKSVSRSIVWQLLGKFVLQGVAFFTTPIFTRILTPDDYGYTALYASWLSITSLILGLQTSGSIGQARVRLKDSEIDGYLSSILSISVISFVVVLFVGFALQKQLSHWLGIRKDLVLLIIIQSFAAYVVNFYIAKLDQYKEARKSTTLSICNTLFSVVLSIIFVIFLSGNNKGIAKIYGQAIPVILIGIYLFFYIYKRGKVLWNREYNRFCLALTSPLIFHALGGLIFSQCDRLMLQKMYDDKALGIYSVTFALCSVLTIIYGALNVSWVPFYYDYKKAHEEKIILERSKRYVKFFTVITLGFILLSADVFKLMAPEPYWTGIGVIPLFVLSNYFSYLYLLPVNFEFYHCKTKIIPVATFLAALINIGINFILIPPLGILGAAIGTAVAHFLSFLFHDVVARFVLKDLHFEYPVRIYIPGLIFVIAFCVLFTFMIQLWYIRWALAVVLGFYLLRDIYIHKSFF